MGNKVNLPAQHPPRHYDDLAEEVPLAIAVNGMALSVMMVSPFDFDDFITGHFLTEGIVKSVVEIKDIQIESMPPGFEARITVTGRREHEVKQRRYSLVSAGCGLCNKTAMDQAFPPNTTQADKRPLAECDVSQLRSLFEANQTYNQKAGAMHAAMLCSIAPCAEMRALAHHPCAHTAFVCKRQRILCKKCFHIGACHTCGQLLLFSFQRCLCIFHDIASLAKAIP